MNESKRIQRKDDDMMTQIKNRAKNKRRIDNESRMTEDEFRELYITKPNTKANKEEE